LKIKSQRDFGSAIMFIVIGVSFAIGALNYTFGSSARPGPAFFPFGLGIILALLGAVVLFTSLTIESEDGDPIGAIAFKPLFIVLSAFVVFGLALPRLGMVVSLPILIILSALAGEEFHWLSAIIMSIALTVLSWAVFIKGLGLTIPLWPAFMG